MLLLSFALMSTQPAPSADGSELSVVHAGDNESVCMRCFETLRDDNPHLLGLKESAHLLDCPQRPC